MVRKRKAQSAIGGGPASTSTRRGEHLLGDVLLTSPIFVVYHIGVVFLSVRNGLDPITDLVLSTLHRSLLAYVGVTLAVAVALAIAVRVVGIRRELHPVSILARLAEAVVYAIVMCVTARSVVAYTLGPAPRGLGPVAALVMSAGAGFYEELAFRVILFAGGAYLVRRLARGWKGLALEIAWGAAAAAAFSAIHYVGALSDSFSLESFVFRWACGAVLTVIFRLRGFAAAVWTHALYDVGVMVL